MYHPNSFISVHAERLTLKVIFTCWINTSTKTMIPPQCQCLVKNIHLAALWLGRIESIEYTPLPYTQPVNSFLRTL